MKQDYLKQFGIEEEKEGHSKFVDTGSNSWNEREWN